LRRVERRRGDVDLGRPDHPGLRAHIRRREKNAETGENRDARHGACRTLQVSPRTTCTHGRTPRKNREEWTQQMGAHALRRKDDPAQSAYP